MFGLLALLLVLAPAASAGEAPPPTAPGTTSCKSGDPGVHPPQVVAATRQLPVAPPASTPPGRAVLRVLVGEDGRVAGIEVLRAPYGGEALKSDAIAAVRGWRYEPARRDGAVVACWTVESVEFVTAAAPPPPPAPEAPAREPAAPGAPAPATPDSPPREAAGGAPVPATPEPLPREPAPPPPAQPPAPERRSEPPPAIPVPAAAAEPPRGAATEAAIDLTRGGPPPLQLGGSELDAARFLGADPGADSLRADERGLEVTIVERDGERRVASIRYLFAEGRDGFRASPLRTRSGLGKGSVCLGIPAAQGRPAARAALATEGGGSAERLVYESDGVIATFLCVDGRLVELTLAAAER